MTRIPSQRIVPYLYYENGHRAVDFLCRVFGFAERLRVARDDGTLMHAEVAHDESVVMLGTPLDDAGRVVTRDRSVRHSSILCYVDDVDAHHARAKTAGATITSEPADKDYGARMYSAVDLEGHEWYFSTPIQSR